MNPVTDLPKIEQTIQALHPALIPGRGVVFALTEGEVGWVVLQELERRHHPTGDGAGAVLMPMVDRRKTHADPLSKWDQDERLSLEKLGAAIAEQVKNSHGIGVTRVCFLHPGTLPQGSNGEIHRDQSRELFLSQKLELFGEWNPFKS